MQNLLNDQISRPDIAIAYFYFDFNDVEKQSSNKAIRSLLFQLVQQVPGGLHDVEQLWQRCGAGQQQPAEDTIQLLLRNMIDQIKLTYVILDALDECSDHERLLELIVDLTGIQQQGLHLMLTSRQEKDIEEHLRPISNCSINIQSAIVDEDVRVYVHDRLSTDIKLKKWPILIQDEIQSAMMEKANGMCVANPI